MDCPRCSIELAEIPGDESTVHRCSECGGIWVESTDLNRILLHGNLPALSSITGYVNTDEIAGLCPACQVDLTVVEGGEKRSMEYDTCESCGGVWIDGPEDDEPAESITRPEADRQIVEFFKRFSKKK
ncbi:MAG TPA: zf-TFIIB domain-containing protein [Anaeromyxobacteraceae bacterium]|nr:zf-TFIIB domain-containing protein [Anaeromyxobacteraceae bacterium]